MDSRRALDEAEAFLVSGAFEGLEPRSSDVTDAFDENLDAEEAGEVRVEERVGDVLRDVEQERPLRALFLWVFSVSAKAPPRDGRGLGLLAVEVACLDVLAAEDSDDPLVA
jgi:hypothetical protein